MELCICTELVSMSHHIVKKRHNKLLSSNEISVLTKRDQFHVGPQTVQVLGFTQLTQHTDHFTKFFPSITRIMKTQQVMVIDREFGKDLLRHDEKRLK